MQLDVFTADAPMPLESGMLDHRSLATNDVGNELLVHL